jgi:hypothetical protein
MPRQRVGAYAPPDDRLRRGIQYSAASERKHTASGILDRPPSLTMTAESCLTFEFGQPSETKQSIAPQLEIWIDALRSQ